MNTAIVVFARHPTPGRVKTRLAAGVGKDDAARFYKQCAEYVIQECLKTSATVFIAFSAAEEEDQVRAWLSRLPDNERLHYFCQIQSPNLGDRLAAGMKHAFLAGYHRVAVTGTDVPDLTSAQLERSLQQLDVYDAVFGPAADGGYYLLALKDDSMDKLGLIFNNIEWSTEVVLTQNIANVENSGLNMAPIDTLEKLRDIDTVGDLREWILAAAERNPGHPVLSIAQAVLQN